MKIHQVPIRKERLLAMPEVERTFLLGIGHIANEIMVLQKLAVASAVSGGDGDALLLRIHATQTLTLVRLLAGKLLEAWEFLGRAFYANRLGQTWDADTIGAEAADSLSVMAKYFGRADCLVRTIRNEFGFHYDKDQIAASPELIGDDEAWEIILADTSGNSLYYVADLVANHALLKRLAVADDVSASLEKILDDIGNIAGAWSAFVGGCWAHAMETYFPIEDERDVWTRRDVEGAPHISEVQLEFFHELSKK
ncbi:hypothetical protein [Dyella terrae]|uniref:hypothetical protein n=1 Tax=Dyella terrae TaxID=522259 RepID=UPI001EFC5E7F|nr:hypothetical protein [Dyella terrae]ULU26758.1 hypothetical protein DYST_03706 [Dyella terrae]